MSKKKIKRKIKTLDDIKDLSIGITDILVENGIVKDCTDSDDEDEFNCQDAIRDYLCKKYKIEND